MSTQPLHIPEYRALMVFDQVPASCILQLVGNSESAPHLRPGEFAVVDTSDTDPQHGELYLIRWMSGGTDIVQAFCRPGFNSEIGHYIGWWTRSLRRRDYDQEVAKAARAAAPGAILSIPRGCMVDGPRREEQFRQALVGRVVGIYQASVELPLIEGLRRG
ncbi:hypothetical protein ACFQX9_30135 [Bradyrhizobium sp. GCM10028915]|uniref:hypothetical protein n=1 Tax=unclassified Bradyrhizobium TaxID=2631580 RepID=UPI003614AE4D